MFYMLDFYDLGCSMKPLEQISKKIKTCKLIFPNGSECICTIRQHKFCVATILKCIDNNEAFDAYVEKNKAFLISQQKQRKKINTTFFAVQVLLLVTYIFVTVLCLAVNYSLIILAFFLILLYNYYIYPSIVLIVTNRHLDLIVSKTEKND